MRDLCPDPLLCEGFLHSCFPARRCWHASNPFCTTPLDSFFQAWIMLASKAWCCWQDWVLGFAIGKMNCSGWSASTKMVFSLLSIQLLPFPFELSLTAAWIFSFLDMVVRLLLCTTAIFKAEAPHLFLSASVYLLPSSVLAKLLMLWALNSQVFNTQLGMNMGAMLWDEQSWPPASPFCPTNQSLHIQAALVDGKLNCSWHLGWAEYLPDKSLKGLACNNVPQCLAWANSTELTTELHGNKQWD